MKFIKVSNLLNKDSFLIECIRIWIKSMVYYQNPIELLKKLLHNYGIEEKAISLNDFMGCSAISSVKKYDFRITNCQFVGNSEEDILMILYTFLDKVPGFLKFNLIKGKKRRRVHIICVPQSLEF